MTPVAKKVFDEVLSLPAETRVSLVEKPLISLNLPTRPKIDRLGSKEVERRISQIDKGEVKLLSGEKVFANIRKKVSAMKFYSRPDAQAEFDKAVEYYEQFKRGLGLDFAEEVYATISRIIQYPEVWRHSPRTLVVASLVGTHME